MDVGPESVAPLIGEPWFGIFVCCCETLETVDMKQSWGGEAVLVLIFVERKIFSSVFNGLSFVEVEEDRDWFKKVTDSVARFDRT